ncbi:MAG: hypothetical protein R2815_04235 [Flavobacteriales bacterium]|nr:hypothetical protein [Flavobacteriales bacterium]
MEEQRIDQLLSSVERVDPPTFLLIRIEARIAARLEQRPARAWVWAASFAMVLVLTANSYVLLSGARDAGGEDALEQLASGMSLDASNQLYHD